MPLFPRHALRHEFDRHPGSAGEREMWTVEDEHNSHARS
jgi:hypothetical protein